MNVRPQFTKCAVNEHDLISLAYYYYSTGGANQNTIRVAQWMLQRKHATTFFGCVGEDKMAEEMRKKAEEVGVRVVYQINKEAATGTQMIATGKLFT